VPISGISPISVISGSDTFLMLKYLMQINCKIMKKLLVSLALSLVIISNVSAATIVSDYGNNIAQNITQIVAPITITASSASEITAKNGINLMLDSSLYILWNAVDTIEVSGTAVTSGHMSAQVTPEYMKDYKVLHIPVLADFASGESIALNNVQMRSYNRDFSARFIDLDITGDYNADATDINGYKVDVNSRTDQTPPYPVTDVKYTFNSNKTYLTLTWNNPADYDVIAINIDKTLTRDKVTNLPETVLNGIFTEEYTDNNIKVGDSIVYKIYAKDRRNDGEIYTLKVDVTPVDEEASDGESTEPTEEPTDVELTQLGNLYGYYKIRYFINCMRGGIAAQANDSACLWARIDVAYAQDKLSKSDISTSITDYDITLLSGRMKYPEQRYQTNCIDAQTPANYCSALKKAIDRAHYFIEK
jgi:hypothetical protein